MASDSAKHSATGASLAHSRAKLGSQAGCSVENQTFPRVLHSHALKEPVAVPPALRSCARLWQVQGVLCAPKLVHYAAHWRRDSLDKQPMTYHARDPHCGLPPLRWYQHANMGNPEATVLRQQGMRHGRAPLRRYQHLDMADLEAKLQEASGARVKLIATDGMTQPG